MTQFQQIRLLSYNLHKGKSLGNLKNLLPDMKKVLHDTEADIVFLQEVRGDQYEFLADQAWPHHSYGKNAIYRSGNHGNAILSKWPIREIHNLNLSQNRFERRGLLHGLIVINSTPVHLFCTHLDLLEGSRQKQLQAIASYVKSELNGDSHLILAGDFNDWRQMATRTLEESLGVTNVFSEGEDAHPATFPSLFPVLSLDRLFYRGFRRKHAEVWKGTPWNKLSDHLPIAALIELKVPKS